MFAKMSQDTKLLVNIFLPFFLIYSVQHVYLIYGNLLQSYEISHEATGWILGVYFLAAMLVRPLGGWLLENFGIRRTLVWSGMLSFIGCSLFFFKQSVFPLFIGRAISGAGFGIYTTGLFSHQALCVSEKMRGAMFSLLVVGGILPISTVTPLGEWLLLGSRETLYLAIGPALSAACCFLGGRVNVAAAGETRGGGEKSWGTYGVLFSSRPFLFLVFTGTTIALVDAFIVNISLLALEKGLAASYFLVSLSISAVVVRLAGSPLQNTLPRVALLAPCGILMSCSMILASFFPASGVFVAAGILFGVGIGAGWPMYHALIGDLLDPPLFPKGTATALLLYDAGYFVTPLTVGYFLPRFGTSGTFMAISLAAGGALVFIEVFYWLPLYWKSRAPRP
ncbi:MAG: MFS transporter [Synergistaceae bacterium]|nr:MFS transporter [Synergistaceae bacterium]